MFSLAGAFMGGSIRNIGVWEEKSWAVAPFPTIPMEATLFSKAEVIFRLESAAISMSSKSPSWIHEGSTDIQDIGVAWAVACPEIHSTLSEAIPSRRLESITGKEKLVFSMFYCPGG
jgi:hypothetical protein